MIMNKTILLSICTMLVLTACVSKKDYLALQEKQKETQDLLNTATVKLNTCLEDKASASARAIALEERIADLRNTNKNETV